MKSFYLIILAATMGPADPSPDALLLADFARARHLSREVGDEIWPSLSAAPFGVLIIDGGRETLLCQENPPQGFVPEGIDLVTGCVRFGRPAGNFPDNLLAAMPVFGSASTIVMGTPERTGLTRTGWMRTILHEHFHQWQTSRPGYYARVEAMGLSEGDESGMWMLNFPFPYADERTGDAYRTASFALADALAARRSPQFWAHVEDYMAARRAFAQAAGSQNWRYLDFQLWQEGGARWTEITITKQSSDAQFQAEGIAVEHRTLESLRSPDLVRQGRELAYSFGASELMLLDMIDPRWRARYETETGLTRILEDATNRTP
jgi:hypothetical protein